MELLPPFLYAVILITFVVLIILHSRNVE